MKCQASDFLLRILVSVRVRAAEFGMFRNQMLRSMIEADALLSYSVTRLDVVSWRLIDVESLVGLGGFSKRWEHSLSLAWKGTLTRSIRVRLAATLAFRGSFVRALYSARASSTSAPCSACRRLVSIRCSGKTFVAHRLAEDLISYLRDFSSGIGVGFRLSVSN